MTGVAWLILTLVFLDEVLAVVALGVTGAWLEPAWLWVWLLPAVGVALWWAFASPKAPYGGGLVRPLAKVVVFGLACVALWDAGHEDWAVALLVFSVVVNGLAQLPSIRVLVDE